MNIYRCRKCGEIKRSTCRPLSGGCRKPHMFHDWLDLGEVPEYSPVCSENRKNREDQNLILDIECAVEESRIRIRIDLTKKK